MTFKHKLMMAPIVAYVKLLHFVSPKALAELHCAFLIKLQEYQEQLTHHILGQPIPIENIRPKDLGPTL